ncbi:hypothetical protein Tco_1009863, partial [Tanacetum coccineum]
TTILGRFVLQWYIRGKPNGKLIWKSIQNGPTPHPMITDPPPTDSTVVPAPRKKLDSEFNEEENKLEMADTQAEIILRKVFPDTSSTTKSNKHCKEIWDMWELRMPGSCKTLQQRKEDLILTKTGSGTSPTQDFATVHDGHIVLNQFRGRLPGSVKNQRGKMDSQSSKISFTDGSKEKGDVLDG